MRWLRLRVWFWRSLGDALDNLADRLVSLASRSHRRWVPRQQELLERRAFDSRPERDA